MRNDAKRCRATKKDSERCTLPARHGVLCHRHARQLVSVGTTFRLGRLRSCTLRGLDDSQLSLASKSYSSSGGAVDPPKSPSAYALNVLRYLEAVSDWVNIQTIAELISTWRKKETSTREASACIRVLHQRGLAERRYIGGATTTLWRATIRNDANDTRQVYMPLTTGHDTAKEPKGELN